MRRVGERSVDEHMVVVGSVKGAPGATTLAVAITAGWPVPGALLVEADPDGGDLAARFGHRLDPGLVSFATAARSGGADLSLRAHAQRLAVGVDVVLAPPGDAAIASVQSVAYLGARTLRHAAGQAPVIIDVGRMAQGGPGLTIAALAADVVLVVRPTLEELTQVQARLGWLRDAVAGRLWLALAGAGPYRPAEVTRHLQIEVAGEVPINDRPGAGVLAGRLVGNRWHRLALPRAARAIAVTLHDAQARHASPPVIHGVRAQAYQ